LYHYFLILNNHNFFACYNYYYCLHFFHDTNLGYFFAATEAVYKYSQDSICSKNLHRVYLIIEVGINVSLYVIPSFESNLGFDFDLCTLDSRTKLIISAVADTITAKTFMTFFFFFAVCSGRYERCKMRWKSCNFILNYFDLCPFGFMFSSNFFWAVSTVVFQSYILAATTLTFFYTFEKYFQFNLFSFIMVYQLSDKLIIIDLIRIQAKNHSRMLLNGNINKYGIMQYKGLQVFKFSHVLFHCHYLYKRVLCIWFVIASFPVAAMTSLVINSHFNFNVFQVFQIFTLGLELYPF